MKLTLEQAWVKFQLDIAAIRGALGPLYDAAAEARRRHTFIAGQEPPQRYIEAIMGATAGEPNGIPDAFTITTQGTYVARTFSVMAPSVILIWLDTAIQRFAKSLGQPEAENMLAGDEIAAFNPNDAPVKASTLIWAGANGVRHVDAWFFTSNTFVNPVSRRDRERRDVQMKSMEPLTRVLGCPLPITENVAFEVFQVLTEVDDTKGTYDRLELHVLRIGRDLIERAGLIGADIGLTVTGIIGAEALAGVAPNHIVLSDGIARAASSLPDTGRIGNVRPVGKAADPEEDASVPSEPADPGNET